MLLIDETMWYVDADGGLDVVALLAAFQEFFREHSEHWVARVDYREAGPQLLLQAFLQRVVNGGGRIRPRAYRPARGVAAGRAGAQVRRRVQGAAQGARAHHPRRTPADPGLHGLICSEFTRGSFL